MRTPAKTVFKNPSMDEDFRVLYKKGYQCKPNGIANFKKGKLLAVWEFLCHYIIRCLSGTNRGADQMSKQFFDTLWSIFT